MRAFRATVVLAVLAGCSGSPEMDAGVDSGSPMDSGVVGPSCNNGGDCRGQGWDVCRQGRCAVQVACSDDVECGLGESCVGSTCQFTGCVVDADCGTGKCRSDVFECAECGSNADCPAARPVCQTLANTCVACASDSDCQPPGPGYCDATSGQCVSCLTSDQCSNGFFCDTDHACHGATSMEACSAGVSCDLGFTCVSINNQTQCATACSLYHPSCAQGEICFKLTFSGTDSLVFDTDGPTGVCFAKPAGLRDYNQSCTRSGSMSNCEPNLICVPEDGNLSLCRTFCDPNDPNACPVGELCHGFPGDTDGHRYGLCYRDNGWGDSCVAGACDAGNCAKLDQCDAGESCQPYDDPSDFTNAVAPICQFDVGSGDPLAPCAPLVLSDGGMRSADSQCKTGACVGDPNFAPTLKYFCYGACAVDSDCSVGGHTGTCDGTFNFSTSTGTPGTELGCRPHCDSNDDCTPYGQGNTCRPLLVPGYTSSLTEACTIANGTHGPGEPCNSPANCASGFCVQADGRGTARFGYCGVPCTSAAQCATDGGAALVVSPLDCISVDQVGFIGFDGVPSTYDDVVWPLSLCTGARCTTDSDCDAGFCAPDLTSDGGLAVVRHCQPSTGNTFPDGGTCQTNGDCPSGVCGQLQPPSSGFGFACFTACDLSTVCPGTMQCRAKGMRIQTVFGTQDLDTCAP